MLASFRKRHAVVEKALLACLLVLAYCPGGGSQQKKASVPAAGPLPETVVRARADALLAQMTPREKIGQMTQIFLLGSPDTALETRIKNGEIGAGLFVIDPVLNNRIQRMAVEGSRLHIPMLFGFDVIHGFKTIFPVPIAMAATWDPETVERAQAVAAKEASSVGIKWTFAPMVDIARDPRWGRIVEGAGEDPFLGSAMAVAQVRGFQGEYLGAPDHIIACAKHFAGYGAAEGGRDYDAAEISDSQLWNVYFPPFKSAIDVGVGTLMSAYMDLNGVPATGNRWLLHDVLRDKWHFHGFVVSDSDAVKSLSTHGFARDEADAAYRAANAGVNMEMSLRGSVYSSGLTQDYADKRINDAELDEAVRPILETKIRLGLFENPYVDEAGAHANLQTKQNYEIARVSAERSAVLLRNEGSLLPLKQSYRKIAVIGSLADSKPDIAGPWAFASDKQDSVTVREGVKQGAPFGTTVEYAGGVQVSRKFPLGHDSYRGTRPAVWTETQAALEYTKAIRLAQDSDVSIVVLGENQDMDGEASSRSTLGLPGRQEELLEAVVAAGKPVVLLLMSARPLDLRWAAAHVPAVLDIWYPGTEGGAAVANLLFGKTAPGGKLPFTWVRDVGQVPTFYGHYTTQEPEKQGTRYWNEESTPLFPFGYGLSYTTFELSNLRLSDALIKPSDPLEVSVDVRNSGTTQGDEVVQLYLHQQSGTSSRPVRELKGFQRVALAPGEIRNVKFTLTDHDRTYWSTATQSWVQDASALDVWIGTDSNATLHAAFSVSR